MALTLPYPGMDFTPLDILTADEMDQLVANIEYIATQCYPNTVTKTFPTVESANIANTGYQRVDKLGRMVIVSMNFNLSSSVPTGTVLVSGCPAPTERTIMCLANGADGKAYRAYVHTDGKVYSDGVIGTGWSQGQCMYFSAS